MKSEKQFFATKESQLATKLNEGLQIVELEERLEMVQADALAAVASCCMDSTETAPK